MREWRLRGWLGEVTHLIGLRAGTRITCLSWSLGTSLLSLALFEGSPVNQVPEVISSFLPECRCLFLHSCLPSQPARKPQPPCGNKFPSISLHWPPHSPGWHPSGQGHRTLLGGSAWGVSIWQCLPLSRGGTLTGAIYHTDNLRCAGAQLAGLLGRAHRTSADASSQQHQSSRERWARNQDSGLCCPTGEAVFCLQERTSVGTLISFEWQA